MRNSRRYRATTSPRNFYVLRSSDNGCVSQPWGDHATDIVTPGDFDGDGRSDLAVFRAGGAEDKRWYILQSSNGAFRAQQWDIGTDSPAPVSQTR